jgi:hypothetical protein
MCTKLVTNDQSRASSFSARVTCQCLDSSTWSSIPAGSKCSAIGHRPGSPLRTCEANAEDAAAEGVTLSDSRGASRVLAAKEACPLACGACDACSSFPCENGGTCTATSTSAPAHHYLQQETCIAADMSSSTTTINAQCCGADDAECAGGLPTSCDAGCAASFLPFWASCGSAMQGAADYLGVVALCETWVAEQRAYQCACAKGWQGSNCADKNVSGFELVNSKVAITDDGKAFIEKALPAGAHC